MKSTHFDAATGPSSDNFPAYLRVPPTKGRCTYSGLSRSKIRELIDGPNPRVKSLILPGRGKRRGTRMIVRKSLDKYLQSLIRPSGLERRTGKIQDVASATRAQSSQTIILTAALKTGVPLSASLLSLSAEVVSALERSARGLSRREFELLLNSLLPLGIKCRKEARLQRHEKRMAS